MKFRVTLKDPNGVDHAVRYEVQRFMEEMREVGENYHLDASEISAMERQHEDVVRDYIRRWFKWSEYLQVEIDTDLGTCTVVMP